VPVVLNVYIIIDFDDIKRFDVSYIGVRFCKISSVSTDVFNSFTTITQGGSVIMKHRACSYLQHRRFSVLFIADRGANAAGEAACARDQTP